MNRDWRLVFSRRHLLAVGEGMLLAGVMVFTIGENPFVFFFDAMFEIYCSLAIAAGLAVVAIKGAERLWPTREWVFIPVSVVVAYVSLLMCYVWMPGLGGQLEELAWVTAISPMWAPVVLGEALLGGDSLGPAPLAVCLVVMMGRAPIILAMAIWKRTKIWKRLFAYSVAGWIWAASVYVIVN